MQSGRAPAPGRFFYPHLKAMLRSAFIIFIAGWVLWFMLDKPGAAQFGFPQRSDDLLGNFQHAFDMLKAGFPWLAFIFIWKQHYIILSLLSGALLAVLAGGAGDLLRRRRMRRAVMPGYRQKQDGKGEPGPPAAPTGNDELVSNERVE